MRINSLPLFNRRRRRQTREYLSNEDYSWIWEPFKDAKNSKLAQTACLAAEIIANSSPDKIPKVPFNLDPRIVIPLCAIALQKELNNLNNINQVNIQEFDYREDVVDYFLEITQPSPRWRYLFNSLSPELQYQLCYRLSNYRRPNKNDWRNLFKNNIYQFNTSLHYAFILALLLVICLVAIIGMYSVIRLNVNIVLSIFVIWNFIILVAFWFYWGKQGFDFIFLQYINYDNEFIIYIFVFIVFILSILLKLLLSNNIISLTILNSLIYFCYIAFMFIDKINNDDKLIIEVIIEVIFVSSITIIIGSSITTIIGLIIASIPGSIIDYIALNSLSLIVSIIIFTIVLIIMTIIVLTMVVIIQSYKRLFVSTVLLPSFLSALYFVNYTLINLLSLGWREVLLFWLTTLGIGATLYLRGKTLDYKARNPLKGILDNTIMQ